MVDFADISQATALVNEKQSITVALDNLEHGGRIVAMTIAPPQPEQPEGQPPMPLAPMMMGTTVPTHSIEYPPEVVTAIEAALVARQEEIAEQLAGMGVSGVETPQRRKRK